MVKPCNQGVFILGRELAISATSIAKEFDKPLHGDDQLARSGFNSETERDLKRHKTETLSMSSIKPQYYTILAINSLKGRYKTGSGY